MVAVWRDSNSSGLLIYGLETEKKCIILMHLFCSGGLCASAYIIRTQPEILNSLSHTAGPHMYLPVTLCSNGMLALDDDDSRFLKGSWCEGAWTVQGFPNSEKHQHGHHNANSPRDGAHGWASCDHIRC